MFQVEDLMQRSFFNIITKILLFFLFCSLATVEDLYAKSRRCYNWPRIFQANQQLFAPSPQDKRLVLFPYRYQGKDPQHHWLGVGIQRGLAMGLEPIPGLHVEIISSLTQDSLDAVGAKKQAQERGADYALIGSYRIAGDELFVYTQFLPLRHPEHLPPEESRIEWPRTEPFRQLLLTLSRRISKAFKELRIKKKQIMGLLPRFRNFDAYRFWVLGQEARQAAQVTAIKNALAYYKKSRAHDFNFCYAYLGLAQSLTEAGFIKKVSGQDYRNLYQEAQLELGKVGLLCPELTLAWAARITQYLEADVLQISAEQQFKQGQKGLARQQAEEALKLLPGDPSSWRLLGRLGRGSAKKRYQELSRCP